MKRSNRLDYWLIGGAFVLLAGLMNVIIWLFWSATAGMPNAIDNDPGLPVVIDWMLTICLFMVNSAAFIIPWRLWTLTKTPAKKVNKWTTKIPGPPISKFR